MPARLNRMHSELVLKRIRTSVVLDRLQKHVLGQLKNPNDGEPLLMTDSQVRGAIFLIERTLAKAEAPKKVNLTGNLTLVDLIGAAISAEEQPHALDS